MVKLNLRQNALHTLLHGIEHLHNSEREETRSFDHDTHSVEWREDGHLVFSSPEADFTRPPATYNLKFALLHLIQSAELLLKCYVKQCDPAALFIRPGFTIGFQEALKFTVKRNPDLLAPAEHALLLKARDFRNDIEHYEFAFEESNLRELCIAFLAICGLLAQKLLSLNLLEVFDWDHLRDRPDPVSEYLPELLRQASSVGQSSIAI